MTKFAIILAGCGHLDGTEIREAILTLLNLSKYNIAFECFAPDIIQQVVTNHLTGEQSTEQRNLLYEAARIARSEIKELAILDVNDFDALVIPGGYGVIKSLSNITTSVAEKTVFSPLNELIVAFWQAKKPIGGICIASTLITLALHKHCRIKVTIGQKDYNNLVTSLGGIHVPCLVNNSVSDVQNKIFTTPAYMEKASLYEISLGIEKMLQDLREYIA